MANVDFVKQLDRQLRYIETSALEFDMGNRDEGIRIATSLRVIFHQTNQSTSLLAHLRASLTKIATTVPSPPYSTRELSPLVMFELGIRVHGPDDPPRPHDLPISILDEPICFPLINRRRMKREIQAPEWWDKEPTMYLHGHKLTRKNIVLWAANKDGGAHVDDQLPSEYLKLNDGCFNLAINWGGVEIPPIPVKSASGAILRQMAHEVLNSRELLGLAGRQKAPR